MHQTERGVRSGQNAASLCDDKSSNDLVVFGTGRHKLVPAVVHFQSRSGGFRTIHQLGAPFVIFSTNIVVVSHVRTNLVESVHGAFPLESMEICSESMAVTGIDAALRTPNPRGILPLVYQQLFSRTEHHVSVCVSACV